MWAEMQKNWNEFAITSQTAIDELVAKKSIQLIEPLTTKNSEDEENIDYSAENKTAQTQTRVGQYFFRRAVLSAYDGRCCITGLSHSTLLVASHIVPWRSDKENRLNPRNGLCLSSFHDRAFDQGLFTVMPDYSIKISNAAKKLSSNLFASEWLVNLEGKQIAKPEKFSPSVEFMQWHNEHIFLDD
jgi:predicted restriction endonuclease